MILATAFRAEPKADVTWSPLDYRWYQPSLGLSTDVSGLYLSAESIFQCSTVLAAIRFLATSVAMCPPQAFRSEADRRVPIPEHPLQKILRQPNAKDTDFEWLELNVLRVATWGNAYNRIYRYGDAIAALIPLEPWLVKITNYEPDGSPIYEYAPPSGEPLEIMSPEMLHFRGMSFDGYSGAEMYALIRNAVGIALLAERHVGTFLKKGTRLGGLLTPATPLSKEQRADLRESFNADTGGSDKTGTIGILPFGVDFKPMVGSNREAQLGEMRDFQVGEILRFLGVPGVVVGYADKTATYASAKEFFESGGIKHCILPWLVRFERRINRTLVNEPDVFVKFNLDVLLRANTKDRFEALNKATGRPFMTGNEARAIEDLNPDPDPSMDKVLMPANMLTGEPEDEPPAPALPGPPPPVDVEEDDEEEDEDEEPEDSEQARRFALARQIVADRAAQVVRREIAALTDARTVGKLARDPAAWRAWVAAYYDRHTKHVSEVLRMDEKAARTYTDGQKADLFAGGLSVLEGWEAVVAPRLAAAALGE